MWRFVPIIWWAEYIFLFLCTSERTIYKWIFFLTFFSLYWNTVLWISTRKENDFIVNVEFSLWKNRRPDGHSHISIIMRSNQSNLELMHKANKLCLYIFFFPVYTFCARSILLSEKPRSGVREHHFFLDHCYFRIKMQMRNVAV